MMRNQLKKQHDRKGAALVEFAIVAPLLFLLFFASMEFCRVAMIRHTADNAVYEGCRAGIIPGATTAEVHSETEQILNSLGLNNVSIAVTPPAIDRDTDEVTVRVTVPLDDNSFVPNQFVAGRSVIRELTLRREGIR
jgi:Flp pilus assembly protein TadG